MKCKTSTITEGKCDTSGDIVFCTVQTLITYIEKGELSQDLFGMLIVDECFPAGTKISTPTGYRNIEDISIGDVVYSYNHNTNKVEKKKVNYLFQKDTNELIEITLSNGKKLVCTDNHPIYCNGKYIKAKDVKKGDIVYELQFVSQRNKNRVIRELRVESVEVQKQGHIGKQGTNFAGIKVFNIGVDDNNNYFANDILVHNCHRVSTNPQSIQMFKTCIDYFACKYRLGLTATLHRADKLEECITRIIGDVIYEIVKKDNNYCCMYEGKELLRFDVSKFQVPAHIHVIDSDYNISDKDVFDKNGGTVIFARLISDLAMNEERNNLILSRLNSISGSTLVLSDRVEQLKYLCEQVDNGVQIDGGTPKKQRQKALEDMRNGKKKYLFASYSLAKEGLDVPIIENLIMATPVKDMAIVTQSVGRIQRPCSDKKEANVYDFVDDVGMLRNFYVKRRSTYKKNGWQIENKYMCGGK